MDERDPERGDAASPAGGGDAPLGEPAPHPELGEPQKPEAAAAGDYDENKVQVLEGIEHVRKRPSMYIGDTTLRGLHHLVYEVVDNAVDEAMAGACRNISVTIHPDGAVSVEDDGRGFPVGIKKEHNMSALELCLTKLGAGAKFDRDSYKVSGGLHGVGISVVNALSERCEVQTRREGKLYAIGFERGKTTRPLHVIGKSERTGTRVTFKPDPELFANTEFQFDTLAKRLKDLAYLNPGLRISITDERNEKREEYYFEEGVKQFVQHLNEGKNPLHPPVRIRREDPEQRLICDIAFQYTDAFAENVLSFANNINTSEGGTHLSGFRSAFTRAINNYARKSNLFKPNDPTPSGEDIREGLTAVISVMVPEPQFEGQIKTKLGNSEVGTFVETTMNERLSMYLEEHPSEAKRIVSKVVQAAQAREAARKARETARKSAMSSSGMSRKLVDCSSRKADETELFIVEGDSAAGSAKGYRDSRTQAILPIRGKILNVEKARLHKILNHDEILEIIKAIGTGIGAEEFDISKLRYGKIILMTDADVDGSHIRTLLLTFLFRHLRPLIDEGVVYIAQPPLYQLKKGKTIHYVLDDALLNARLTELGVEHTTLRIQREDAPSPVTLASDELRNLLALVERIQADARVLGRRGIEFEAFVQQYLRDGKLPIARVQYNGDVRFFYSESEVDRFEEQCAAEDKNFVVHELTETRRLERSLLELLDYSCNVDDLFLRREEQITGELSRAVFVLEHGDDESVELPNLMELPNGVRSIGARGWEIKRFKGLGEMNKEELWSTTMDPENRVLRKVVVCETDSDAQQAEIDASEANRIFSILMGEDTEVRREFIQKNAIHVKNLDI
ncbi:MAG: DNA gyrase subunit B [Planctomycetota bacterium]|nr:MAG: DNA gyrase subunit B [Planctomycetota bacterium]